MSAHEGHHEKKIPPVEIVHQEIENINQEGRPATWTQWVGSFYLIFIHFPIVLINMLAISESLFGWSRRPLYEFSSRFLLYSAAIAAPLTALLGLIYSYSTSYNGYMETLLLWHMWFGILTAIFTVVLALMRNRGDLRKLYYGCLVLLVIMVNTTAFYGGGMTFGPFHMHPPL